MNYLFRLYCRYLIVVFFQIKYNKHSFTRNYLQYVERGKWGVGARRGLRTKRPCTQKFLFCIVLIFFLAYICDFPAQKWYGDLVLMCLQHLHSHVSAVPVSERVSHSVKQLSTELIKDALDSFLMKIVTCHSRLKQPQRVLVIICSPTKAWRQQLIHCLSHLFSLFSYKLSALQLCGNEALGILLFAIDWRQMTSYKKRRNPEIL